MSPAPAPRQIFVYGTLRTDLRHPHPRSEILTDLSFQGAETDARMYNLGRYPAIVTGNGRVTGQLFFGSRLKNAEWEDLLFRLDRIEGVPRLYERKRVSVDLPGGNRTGAWTYVFAKPELLRPSDIVESGDWRDVIEQ